MANLHSTYLGLELTSPLIIGSSGLSSSVDRIKQYQANGAGAVVLKSLFEEQILNEVDTLSKYSDYTEAADYLKHYVTSNNLREYIELIKAAKDAVSVPVVASVCCTTASKWVDFASRIEQAGADALEINVFMLPTDSKTPGADLERIYFELADKVISRVNIPVAFKLGAHFTNPLYVIEQLYARGAKGVVLFNRFYAPDIDIDSLSITHADIFSKPSDIRNTLRWVGLTSHLVPKIDISASTGVHDGEALIKLLLAGATTVQTCSAIYKMGPDYIAKMLRTLDDWMNAKGYDSLNQFRGNLNYGQLKEPSLYERSQFMKYFSDYV